MAQRKIYAKNLYRTSPRSRYKTSSGIWKYLFQICFSGRRSGEVIHSTGSSSPTTSAWTKSLVSQYSSPVWPDVGKNCPNNIHSSLCKNSPKVTNLFWLLLEAIWFSRTLKNSVLNTNFIPVAPFRLYGCHHVCHFSTFRFWVLF